MKRGVFSLKEVGDTYINMSAWGKGHVWLNGHNLGRYWNIGPQQTLYIPAQWLKKGKNEIVVFELNKTNQNDIDSIDKAILNELH
jgi:beta-galactosidase